MKTLPASVAELQRENVTFELESIDRMYFNAYVPQLTSAAGVASYFRNYKGHRFASTKEAVEMTAAFKRGVLDFAHDNAIPIIRFEKRQRKDEVMQKHLRKFQGREGVLFIGIAQEKATVPRTIRKRFGPGDGTVPWIDYTTAMVNFSFPPLIGKPASATNSPSCKASFPSPRCGIARATGGSSSRRSSARTLIWADQKTCSSSSHERCRRRPLPTADAGRAL